MPLVKNRTTEHPDISMLVCWIQDAGFSMRSNDRCREPDPGESLRTRHLSQK